MIPRLSAVQTETQRQTEDMHTIARHALADEQFLRWYANRQPITLTRAPMTPRLVSRRYSNGRVLLVVLRKGYKNSGTCAAGGELDHQHSTHLTWVAAADTDSLHGNGAPLQEV